MRANASPEYNKLTNSVDVGGVNLSIADYRQQVYAAKNDPRTSTADKQKLYAEVSAVDDAYWKATGKYIGDGSIFETPAPAAKSNSTVPAFAPCKIGGQHMPAKDSPRNLPEGSVITERQADELTAMGKAVDRENAYRESKGLPPLSNAPLGKQPVHSRFGPPSSTWRGAR